MFFGLEFVPSSHSPVIYIIYVYSGLSTPSILNDDDIFPAKALMYECTFLGVSYRSSKRDTMF